MAAADFTAHLKSALGVAATAPLVFLGNFEVERQWGIGEVGLPRLDFGWSNAIVNRLDEFALLLAGPGDVVVLKDAPDPDYLESLAGLGVALPSMLVVRDSQPEHTVTQDALNDAGVIGQLCDLAREGAAILPHGTSNDEEQLALASALMLATPPEPICKTVNSKVYSRRLADKLGLRQPAGRACDDIETWSDAVVWARSALRAGQQVAIKDAYGVSGKGIAIVRDERRLDQLDQMVRISARRSGAGRLGLVVEEWVAKAADLNYQFTLSRGGTVRFDFVKQAVTENGVHKGHLMPPPLTGHQEGELAGVADRLGAALAADGYFGVVGVDAMLDPDGGLYPVVEINARNNMSTYQVRIQGEILGPGQTMLARHYPLRLSQPLPFRQLRQIMNGLLLDRPGGTGVLVNAFATVNAAFTAAVPGGTTQGRLYAVVTGDDAATVDRLDAEMTRRLAAVRS